MIPRAKTPRRPWISANLAVSADGKTGDVAGHPSGWTSRADHERLLELRATADALLVGRRTLIADRMTLTCPDRENQPLRCVVAGDAEIPESLPLLARAGGDIHWLDTGGGKAAAKAPAGVTIHHMTLAEFLTIMRGNLEIEHVHCEGGGTLIRMLAEMDAIDELHLTLAGHTIFGGQNAPTLTGNPDVYLPQSRDFALTGFRESPGTGECFLTYRRRPQ